MELVQMQAPGFSLRQLNWRDWGYALLILVAASVASWAMIFRKMQTLNKVRSQNDNFEQDFWSGTSLNDLYISAMKNAKTGGPMERVFASGMREYQKLRERRITSADTLMDGTRRAMRASFQREMDDTVLLGWPIWKYYLVMPVAFWLMTVRFGIRACAPAAWLVSERTEGLPGEGRTPT